MSGGLSSCSDAASTTRGQSNGQGWSWSHTSGDCSRARQRRSFRDPHPARWDIQLNISCLHSFDCVVRHLPSTRWGRERPGQQWRHGPLWCIWVWKPGLCPAAFEERSQPERGQLRLSAAHPQSGIRRPHSVSSSSSEAVWLYSDRRNYILDMALFNLI